MGLELDRLEVEDGDETNLTFLDRLEVSLPITQIASSGKS